MTDGVIKSLRFIIKPAGKAFARKLSRAKARPTYVYCMFWHSCQKTPFSSVIFCFDSPHRIIYYINIHRTYVMAVRFLWPTPILKGYIHLAIAVS